MSKTNNITCNNCGKLGHMFYQCKLPIISYGIILFRFAERGVEYLMIRRKNSFGFIDFVRGKYSPNNLYQIQNIINEMSIEEKNMLLNESFDSLWKNMWQITDESSNLYKNEEISSSKKMDVLRDGLEVNGVSYNLKQIIENSNTSWIETEWEFPKGRRNSKEKDLDCALREFEEETGISKNMINVVENIIPFEEIFIGTNYKSYKHKYFLANMQNDNLLSENKINLNNFQKSEVSKLDWKTLDECLESIRPYNLEKKQLILNINKVLEEYRIY